MYLSDVAVRLSPVLLVRVAVRFGRTIKGLGAHSLAESSGAKAGRNRQSLSAGVLALV